jgi:DNA-binding transcriptional regulator YiaG
MSTFATVLKDEVLRLARREARAQIEPVRKASASYRHQIAELKRAVANLERQIKSLSRARKETAVPAAEQGSTRFVAKGLRTLRARLGLSAENLGALAGVSGQSIRNWEIKRGSPGKGHRAALIDLRAIGKREAQARLLQFRPKAAKGTSDVAKKK